MTDQTAPLTEQQLDEITAKAAELRDRAERKIQWPSDNEAHWQSSGWKAGTRNALDKLHVEALVAEVRRLRSEVADQESDVALLRALESAGVDGWDGYEDAVEAASA